jgi:hypothetical protein
MLAAEQIDRSRIGSAQLQSTALFLLGRIVGQMINYSACHESIRGDRRDSRTDCFSRAGNANWLYYIEAILLTAIDLAAAIRAVLSDSYSSASVRKSLREHRNARHSIR